jgi:hypothetical protein
VSDRTFRLSSPLMEGRDIELFQETLNRQFREWRVDCRLDTDGAYGPKTAEAARRVVYGLGIPVRDLAGGVTPELRMRIRHPERRSQGEKARASDRKDWLRRLRRRYDGHGPKAAIAYARKHVGVTESPAGSNRGRLIDRWQRMCEVFAAPWCGCFVNACLVAAGFPSQPWLRFCPWIEGKAKTGEGGWSWHPMSQARPGDLVLFGSRVAQHVELYAGAGVTYGGNTSSGSSGSQDNGGGVFARRRSFSDRGFPARGVARPPYKRS